MVFLVMIFNYDFGELSYFEALSSFVFHIYS